MANKTARLGDLATYINGYAFKPADWGETGLPIIRIQDLTGNSYQLNRYDGEYPERIEVNDGDVLISWSASLGVYVWQRGKALLNQHIFRVVFDKLPVNKDYFVFAVEHKLAEMESKTHGATMKHIVKKDFDGSMKNQLISEITRQMIPYLDNAQMEQLQNVLQHALWNVQITANEDGAQQPDKETNAELLDMFLSAKRVEGCSEKTLRYYETSIRRLFEAVDSHVTHMQTDDLRGYLSDYQQQTQCSKGNIDIEGRKSTH